MRTNRKPRNEPTTIRSTNQQSRKNIQWKRRQSLQKMVLGKLDSNMWKNETGPLSYIIQEKNSKWMNYLNVGQETIKTLAENTGSNLFDLGCRNFLLYMSPKAREAKTKMNYWGFIKTNSFCLVKETTNKIKR